jgi:predicted RNase H-like HicB family nuclease
MLTAYIEEAMRRARYKILDDNTYYGWVQELAGVWAQAATLEECQVELQSVIQDWLLLGLKLGHELPGFDDSEELRGLRT